MPLLSHYTSWAGLDGIARSKSLWATNFRDVNDTSEMEYGYAQLMERSFQAVAREMGKYLKLEDDKKLFEVETAKQASIKYMRNVWEAPGGMEPLYVFSFVRARNEDQERRGILTLWDRYTRLEGYCLQFDAAEVEALLLNEFMNRSYGILETIDVRYGFDEADEECREMLFQMTQYLLGIFKNANPELGIELEWDRMEQEHELALLLVRFIAMRKDRFFEDERETRIIAVPAKPGGIPVCGLSKPKEKRKTNVGRGYIDLGEDFRPAIEPCRIIIGPRAKSDIADIVSLFTRKPEIVNATFPIRGAV